MIKSKGGTRIMKISAIRSDKVYSKIMSAPLDKKNDIYRYELMKPFEKKWACYSVPMKALTPNGYDVTAITIFSNEFTYITFPLFPMAAYTFSFTIHQRYP